MHDPVALLNSSRSIPEAFDRMLRESPDREVYRQSDYDSGAWHARNYRQVATEVANIIEYLKSLGVSRGTKVAIVSSSRPEWLVADMAIVSLGGVSVSVYQSLPPEEMGYILFDSGAEVVFAENQEQVQKLSVLMQTGCFIPATEERGERNAVLSFKGIVAFDSVEANVLVKQYQEIISQDQSLEFKFDQSLNGDDLANLVYTSGTTGPPKGVMQTHRNHLANCRQAYQGEMVGSETSLMLVLPLAHSFAKLMGYLGMLTPTRIMFSAVADRSTSRMNAKIVSRDMATAGATVYPLVPRLLEKLAEGIRDKAASRKLLKLAIWAALERYRAIQSGESPSMKVVVSYQLTTHIRRIIKRKLFGPNFVACISGGAKLNPDVARFFDALGIEILEGYGLTETCVATNCNRLGQKKIGSVGPLLAEDIQLKIAEDGEILFRGPNITSGYYNRRAATATAWDEEGWFHTGDLGAIDQAGYLSIIGRKKEIIVTSYGKKVAPTDIENKIASSPYISHAMLAGDGMPYIVAVITLAKEAVSYWAISSGRKFNDELLQEGEVRELIAAEIEKVNQVLASHEQIKKFVIVDGDLSIENGMLTPTMKVKRKVVFDRYRKEIETLFD